MPIKHAIWKVGETPEPLAGDRLSKERTLEDMIVRAPSILSSEWMLIGRQERTRFGGIIDLLAIAPDGSLVVIEPKRDKTPREVVAQAIDTPREVVAQAIDYASWVEDLGADQIAQIYERFSRGKNLSEEFRSTFGNALDEDELNKSHQIILVASELDDSTERIINYLNARDIAINVVFFQVFRLGAEQLLSRAWLIDPGETQANVAVAAQVQGGHEPWNGEYYVSYGDARSRSWEDARKYGFISAGGGRWYSRTLGMLSPGDRVWVKIPGAGYVGVGIVTEPVKNMNDFTVPTEDGERPCLDVLQHAELYRQHVDDPDKAEYFVRVKWLDTRPENDAIQEVGMFGNQNTICQPVSPSWRHTVERLKSYFPNWNGG